MIKTIGALKFDKKPFCCYRYVFLSYFVTIKDKNKRRKFLKI